jgi:hypothetical protein
VQLMTFHLEQFDHLQYGFLQFDLVGGSATDAGGPVDAGAPQDAGMVGQGGGNAGDASTGAAGSGGSMIGSAGAGGTVNSGTGGAGVTGGSAGSSGASTNDAVPSSEGGCSCTTVRNADTALSAQAGGFLLGCALLLRRRRAR